VAIICEKIEKSARISLFFGVLNTNYNKLINLIDEIGGKKEFIIQVIRDAKGTLKKFTELTGNVSQLIESRKQKKLSSKTRVTDIAGHKLAARIHNNFAEQAVNSRHERMISEERILHGYYLVKDTHVDKFRHTIEWVKSLYPELHFYIEGPRPPYSFNTISLKSENTELFGRRQR